MVKKEEGRRRKKETHQTSHTSDPIDQMLPQVDVHDLCISVAGRDLLKDLIFLVFFFFFKSIFWALLKQAKGRFRFFFGFCLRQNLLKDAHLKLCPGQRYGFVGKNGSGKSTLFRRVVDRVSIKHLWWQGATVRVMFGQDSN